MNKDDPLPKILLLGIILFSILKIPIVQGGSQNERLERMFLKGQTYYVREIEGEVSMYNNLPEQTNSDPNTTANGDTVYVGGVANNCLPFGTRVLINDEVYVVNDRMNSRYPCKNFDLFSFSKEEAINFGRQELVIKIIL